MEISKIIESLLHYGHAHLGLSEGDFLYVRNQILRELGLEEIYEGDIDRQAIAKMEVPDELLIPLREWLVSNKGIDGGAAERVSDYIMGLLSPLPSVVEAKFHELYAIDKRSATSYLYDLSIKNDYIKKSRVDKNIHYLASFEKGSDLEISINLSKPEKSNKDIAAALKVPSSGYPKCLLCKENEGFAGNPRHPSRGNLRFIPLDLGGRRWYLQYSPYVYYPEHCIVFLDEHVPMEVGPFSVASLLDFAEQFPHYFIGSNSDLPIVGGSILSHEHFQGGGYDLPLLKAKLLNKRVSKEGLADLYDVDFYDTAICLVSKSKEVARLSALKVHEAWKRYNDIENDIIAHDAEGQHSTSTIIVKKVGDEFRVYMILRNNRKSEKYPDGIFHVHPEFSHIKKEGIGLIEAAGLFILPARLLRQSGEAEEAAKSGLGKAEILAKWPDLEGFEGMVASLRAGLSSRGYIAGVCRYILDNVAVFKKDQKGLEGLKRFLEEVGYGS